MKARILLFVLILGLVFGLTGCIGSSPTATVKNFYNYVERGQYEKAANLLSSQALNTYGLQKVQGMLQMQAEQIRQAGGIKQFKVTDETVVNNQAVVYFEITTGDGNVSTGSVALVKENGAWKISPGK